MERPAFSYRFGTAEFDEAGRWSRRFAVVVAILLLWLL
jgi:hypothetical protein